jgi:bacterial/archaeal transporter family protein
MTWPVLAMISVVTVSIAALLSRVLMREEDSNPIGYAIVFQFGLGLVTLFFAFVFGKFVFPTDIGLIPRFLLSALLWTGGTTLGFSAVKRLGAGETTILGSSNSIISISLGIVLLGEVITLPIIFGMVLIFLSIVLVSSGKLAFTSRQGVIFALLSALCTGIAIVNDAVILKTYEAFSYTTIMSFLPGIVLLIIFPQQITKIGSLMNRKSLSLMGIFCVFYSIQAITFYSAFQMGAPVSQLSPLTKSSIVLTVLLAAIFLKERSHLKRKILAAVVVTMGAILLG